MLMVLVVVPFQKLTKEAIKPGESAPIKVKFDSNGKKGEVTKTVMITDVTRKKLLNK